MPTTKQTIAQWPFERLYVAPFTQRRGFDERSLTYRMVPMEQARQLTGIRVLDMVVDRLIKGPGPKKPPPRYRGYTDPKLSATIHKLTGLTLPELRMHWHMQVARDLLRYTDLPLTEVMQRCGYTSMPPSAAPSAAGGASRRSTSASWPATAATSASTHCNNIRPLSLRWPPT